LILAANPPARGPKSDTLGKGQSFRLFLLITNGVIHGVILKLLERLKLSAIPMLGYWIMAIVGRSLRWRVVGWHNLEETHASGKRWILAFWHGRIFLATYYFRNRGIVVLTSQNRDGEYIARVIQRFGYGVARGSSNRGSHRATVEALRAMKNGKDVGLALDGPRGPRYVAKRGAAYLAKKSGNPVIPFCLAAEKKWVVKSWDHFQIPKPFSRVVLLVGNPICVKADADEEEMRIFQAQIQNSLDDLRERSDRFWVSALEAR